MQTTEQRKEAQRIAKRNRELMKLRRERAAQRSTLTSVVIS